MTACDHGVVIEPILWEEFLNKPHVDAAIFTIQGFTGAQQNPNAYAYVVPQDKSKRFSKVASVSVKKPESNHPQDDCVLVGTFWFRSGKILKEGIEWLVEKNIRVNGELYIDSIFDGLMENHYSVHIFPLSGYICWGEPNVLAQSLYWKDVFSGASGVLRPKFPGIQ